MLNFINELSTLGLYSTLDGQMQPGDSAFLTDSHIIEIKDTSGNVRKPDIAELCRQFVSRLQHKLSPDDYQHCLAESNIFGAAVAYQEANGIRFPNLTIKLMTKK